MKKTFIPVLALAILGVLLSMPAQAAVKAGDKCPTKGKTVTSQNLKYTCIQSGKKLIWNKGVVATIGTKPTASPAPLPTSQASNVEIYTEPNMVSASLEECKIKENSSEGNLRGNLASGFPFMSRFSGYPKEMKFALVPVDFADLPGDAGFMPRMQTQMQLMSEWYSSVSGGKLTVQWITNSDWIRLPGSSKDYSVPYSGAYPETSKFWNKTLPVVDSKMDLSGVQSIAFLLPSGQTIVTESVQSFPFLQEMSETNSSKTKILSFSTAGVYFASPVRTVWSYWAHEFGHALGLAHVGSSRGSSQTINGYDLMGNQDGPYRELSGWMRFIIGWLDDTQVYCQNTNDFTTNEITLASLSDTKSGLKMAVIPTSSASAIIIESRRPTKFSCDAAGLPGGVLVYTYDATLGNQSYFLTAHYPSDRPKKLHCAGNERMENYPDALLHKGESVTVGNYQITVVSSGAYDKVKISKR